MNNFGASIKRLFGKKQFKYGGYSLLITLVGIAVIVLINVGLSQLENNYNLKLDLTSNKQFSLSDQTVKLLKDLQKDIHIYAMYQSGAEDKDVVELLQKYKAASSHITVETRDPDADPVFIAKFNKDNQASTVTNGSVIVTDKDNKLFRVLNTNDLYQASTDEEGNTTYDIKAEGSITSAIDYIVSGYMPNAYIIQGHGELGINDDELSNLVTVLKDENYNVEAVTISQTPDKIKAGDIILFCAPAQDISDDDREFLKPLIEKGGRFVFLFDTMKTSTTKMTNLMSLLELYGVSMKNGVVVETDPTYMMSSQYPTLLAPVVGSSELTTALNTTRSPILFMNSGALSLPAVAPEKSTTTITPLLTTSTGSYLKTLLSTDAANTNLEKTADDEAGPFVLGASIQKTNSSEAVDDARIVVFANMDFTSFGASSQLPNSNDNLVLNCMSWLKNSEKGIFIRSKPLTIPVLGFQSVLQRNLVLLVALLLVPLVALVMGIAIYLRRKHL